MSDWCDEVLASKEFLIKKILSMVPVTATDPSNAVFDEIAVLLLEGLKFESFLPELLDASEKNGMKFPTRLLAALIEDSMRLNHQLHQQLDEKDKQTRH